MLQRFLSGARHCACGHSLLFCIAYRCIRDGKVAYTDMSVPSEVIGAFNPRQDGQIMGLELLSIALGGHCVLHWGPDYFMFSVRDLHIPQGGPGKKSSHLV